MRSKSLTVALMITALTAGVATGAGSAERTSEVRTVAGAFDSIDMRGAATVDVTVGAPQSVKIEAAPNALDQITTELRGSTLVIEYKHGWWNWNNDTRGPVHIAITLPKLAGYSLGGAGETNITGLNGGTIGVALNGAGSVKASGRTDQLSLNLNGAGSADFSKVTATAATVAVNGTGSVHVHAIDDLTASVNGLGSVTYDGAPKHLTKSINGIGSISEAR